MYNKYLKFCFARSLKYTYTQTHTHAVLLSVYSFTWKRQATILFYLMTLQNCTIPHSWKKIMPCTHVPLYCLCMYKIMYKSEQVSRVFFLVYVKAEARRTVNPTIPLHHLKLSLPFYLIFCILKKLLRGLSRKWFIYTEVFCNLETLFRIF